MKALFLQLSLLDLRSTSGYLFTNMKNYQYMEIP